MHAWWSELRSRAPVALLPAIEPAPGTVEVLHAVAGGSSSGPCDSGLFFLGVRRHTTETDRSGDNSERYYRRLILSLIDKPGPSLD